MLKILNNIDFPRWQLSYLDMEGCIVYSSGSTCVWHLVLSHLQIYIIPILYIRSVPRTGSGHDAVHQVRYAFISSAPWKYTALAIPLQPRPICIKAFFFMFFDVIITGTGDRYWHLTIPSSMPCWWRWRNKVKCAACMVLYCEGWWVRAV